MATAAVAQITDHAPLPHSATTFEWPPTAFLKPFEELLPIMARLPGQDNIEIDLGDPTHGTAYLRPQPGVKIPGTLSYAYERRGITYTHARLPQLDYTAKELWKALHLFRPLTTNYAGDFQKPPRRKAPHPIDPASTMSQCPFAPEQSEGSRTALQLVQSAFNWSSILLPIESSGSFYGVVFRSKRAVGSESTNLYSADRLAHEEAVASGGLLMYFYGAPDPITGSNLATCIWTSRAEAIEASSLPFHAKAAVHAKKAYEAFELSRYRIVKGEGEALLRIEAWTEDDD